MLRQFWSRSVTDSWNSYKEAKCHGTTAALLWQSLLETLPAELDDDGDPPIYEKHPHVGEFNGDHIVQTLVEVDCAQPPRQEDIHEWAGDVEDHPVIEAARRGGQGRLAALCRRGRWAKYLGDDLKKVDAHVDVRSRYRQRP